MSSRLSRVHRWRTAWRTADAGGVRGAFKPLFAFTVALVVSLVLSLVLQHRTAPLAIFISAMLVGFLACAFVARRYHRAVYAIAVATQGLPVRSSMPRAQLSEFLIGACFQPTPGSVHPVRLILGDPRRCFARLLWMSVLAQPEHLEPILTALDDIDVTDDFVESLSVFILGDPVFIVQVPSTPLASLEAVAQAYRLLSSPVALRAAAALLSQHLPTTCSPANIERLLEISAVAAHFASDLTASPQDPPASSGAIPAVLPAPSVHPV